MSKHRFHVGELVRTQVSINMPIHDAFMDVIASSRPSGIYEVSRLLPELNSGEPQYQIRCAGEPERVVPESHLIPASRKSQPH